MVPGGSGPATAGRVSNMVGLPGTLGPRVMLWCPGRGGWSTVRGMLEPLSRRRRSARGVELVQLVVVLVVVAVLTTIAYGALSEPSEAARDSYVETTLLAIDLEARSRARSAQNGDPADHLLAVVYDTIQVPEQELALADDEEQRFRLVVDTSSSPARVALMRFGSCSVMQVDPSGRERGRIVPAGDPGDCSAVLPLSGTPYGD